MRLKTLGVVLLTVLALFTVLYWVTDDSRANRDRGGARGGAARLRRGHLQQRPGGAGSRRLRQLPRRRRHGRRSGRRRDRPEPALAPGRRQAQGQFELRAPRRQLRRRRRLGQRQLADAGLELRGRWPAQRAADRGGRRRSSSPGRRRRPTSRSRRSPTRVEAGAEVFATAGCASLPRRRSGRHAGRSPTSRPSAPPSSPTCRRCRPGWTRWPPTTRRIRACCCELWIRDSATNYNDGVATGMPPHPEGELTESQLTALITFLL